MRPPRRLGRFGGLFVLRRPGEERWNAPGHAVPDRSGILGRLIGIVLIDLVLAGDNALVIAMAVRTLPARAQAIGRICGGIGAIVLRIAFTLGAASVLGSPFLQLAGGVLLLWIATKLVSPGSTRTRRTREVGTFLEAVWIIASRTW